jgi:aminoglycoside phosphotransferase (APT) family kinase protein
MTTTTLQAALEGALARTAPGAGSVRDLRRLSGGASQETWAFDLIQGATRRPLILRRAPGGGAGSASAIGLAAEAVVIGEARAAGVQAPEVVTVLEPADGAGEGYVMSRVEGETLPRRILRDAAFDQIRPGLAARCGRELARIHATPTAALTGLPIMDGPTQLHHYRGVYEGCGQPKPVFELAFQWLAEALPPLARPVLVHGDFRHGNLMIAPDTGLAAVLDWELAHLGDPLEDLGWLCVNSWRFGVPGKRVGGFGDLPELLAGYAEAGGQSYREEDILAWEVFGVLRWGIGCMQMYEAFRSSFDRSVERAAIGRRSSECEIDLVNLLIGRAA